MFKFILSMFGLEEKLPPPYKIFFKKKVFCNVIIIQTREHLKGSSHFTIFYNDDTAKKPEWVKKLLSQIGVNGLWVGPHTVTIPMEKEVSPCQLWKNVKGSTEMLELREDLDKLE